MTADVAVVGTGNLAGRRPATGYGCWGENYDPRAPAFRFVFAKGGSVEYGHFRQEIPLEAFGAARTLEIEAADGRTYTIHGSLSAGTYIEVG